MKKIAAIIITILTLGSLNAQIIDCVTGPSGASPQQNNISFTPPAVPCGAFQSYEVWGAEDPSGAFQLIETILVAGQLTSIHSLPASAGPIWYYYIIFNYNCPGNPPIISNTATNEFSNARIEILNVDIKYNPNGITITWEKSPYTQTVGYNIGIIQNNGTVITLGNTTSINDTSFIDIIGLPESQINYTVSIIDGCGNPSSFNPNGYSQVLIDKLSQDRCDQLISIEWKPFVYPYTNPPSLSYNVLVGNGPDTTVVSNQAITATDFNFFDFVDEDTLYFRIEVIDADGNVRSTSSWEQVIAAIVQPPSDFFIEYLTVNAQNKIDVYYYVDTLAEIENFKINNDYVDVAFPSKTVRKDNFDILTKSNPHKYNQDTITDPNNTSYYYQIIANDSCNKDHFSTIGRTIYLSGELADFFRNEVKWNDFELENASITNYRLYRDYGAGMQIAGTFAAGENVFMDNVEQYYTQQGSFCYRIEADYTIPIPYEGTASYTTSSNTMCLEQRPSIYIPNAIAPNGVNNEFKPVIVFGNPTNYSLRVFNRWGELLFESNNPDNGWFGTKNGTQVVSGGYPYNISFTAADGNKVQKSGIVTVIY